jgi:hypothetical protein
MHKFIRLLSSTAACGVLATLIACGGSSTFTAPAPPPTVPVPVPVPQPVTVSILPLSVTVPAARMQQFTATVKNTSNRSVNWLVNGVSGGSPTLGTISSMGVYTAPLTPPAAGQVTITAVTQADKTKFASATVTPVFSNASLSGQYAFNCAVVNSGEFAGVGGVFSADGAGYISNGTEDINDASVGVATNVSFSGTYSIGADGRGNATLSSYYGDTTFKLVLSSNAAAQIIEFDNVTVTSGYVLAQDTNALPNVLGTYVLRLQGLDLGNGAVASVGQVQFDALGNVSGTQDVNDAGSFSSDMPIAGTYTLEAPGRGYATLTTSIASSTFAIYVVDAKTIEFLSVDSGGPLLMTGRAFAQDNITFGNRSLTSGVLLLNGNDPYGSDTFVDAARFDTDLAGNFQNGVLYENGMGSFVDGTAFIGSYAIASNGHGSASISTSNGVSTFVFWMYSSGNAQFVRSDATAIVSGTSRAQQGAPFSSLSLNGNFAFMLGGESGVLPVATVARLRFDGKGRAIGIEDLNEAGTTTADVPLVGAYIIDVNGTGLAALLGSGSTPLRVFMINSAQAGFISADSNQPFIGLLEKQCSDCH